MDMIVPIIKKYLTVSFLIDSKDNSDFYIYIIKDEDTVYNIVFDITHDSDVFSFGEVSWKVDESLAYVLDKSKI